MTFHGRTGTPWSVSTLRRRTLHDRRMRTVSLPYSGHTALRPAIRRGDREFHAMQRSAMP